MWILTSLFTVGTLAAFDKGVCWKNSQTRSTRPLSTCLSHQEKNGLLCYPKCKSGYYGVGPVCWQHCPSGYKDTGAFCQKGGYATGSSGSCPWYDVCGLTFARGCKSCPSGTRFDGCTCWHHIHVFAKKTYGRGWGEAMRCQSNEEQQGALCYGKCPTGYTGTLSTCWQNCGNTYDTKHNGGALCCDSKATCVKKNADLALQGLKTGVSLIATIFSGGAKAPAFAGDVLKLAGGLIVKMCDTSGKPPAPSPTLPAPSPSPSMDTYQLVLEGNCADRGMEVIKTTESCDLAAQALGLNIKNPQGIRHAREWIDNDNPRPEGCYMYTEGPDRQWLWVATGASNVGMGADRSRFQICKAAVAGYTRKVKGCVNGYNIKKYTDKSVQECADICSKLDNCVAFEYGVNYGGKGSYKARDCQPQSSANSAGCNGAYHNLDLYTQAVGRRLDPKSDDIDEDEIAAVDAEVISNPSCLHADFAELAKELGLDSSGPTLSELIESGDVILDNPEDLEDTTRTLADLGECDDDQRVAVREEDSTEAMPAPENLLEEEDVEDIPN